MIESFKVRLMDYLEAAYPILAIESYEENRVMGEIRSVARTWLGTNTKKVKEKETGAPIDYYEWDSVRGLLRFFTNPKAEPGPVNGMEKPDLALKNVLSMEEKSIVVFKDFHPYMEVPIIWRQLRNLVPFLKNRPATLILASSRLKIPPELNKDVQVMEYALPTRNELHDFFNHYMVTNVCSEPEYKNLEVSAEYAASVAEAAMGMTSEAAENAFSMAVIASKRRNKTVKLDEQVVRDIFESKIANLKSSALEYLPTKAGFDSVGGLDLVKSWAMRRRQGFSDRARELNLPYPKGVLLAGIKGTGKTITAMAIAHQFGFPLFKFDVSKLFASKVGESEANTREAIRTIESLGRCILLLDEMEKFFGQGATSGSGDSGTSSRMFGTLISWMSLKSCPAFIVGTLNNFEILPSELIRKGRFDEVFWCDLPSASERIAIFQALLKHKFKFEIKIDDAETLIGKTVDFSGAEIEAVIEEAMYDKMEQPKANLEELLADAATRITPQAKIDSHQVHSLREKAKGFKPASSYGLSQLATSVPTSDRKRSVKLDSN